MYMWERKSILDHLIMVLKTMSGVLLSLAIFLVGKGVEEACRVEAYQEFTEFLTSVTAGAYDGRRGGFPPQFEVEAFEGGNGEYYLSGIQSPYYFSGWTSKNNPMKGMNWRFYGYRGLPWYFVCQIVGFAGMNVCLLWGVLSRLWLHTTLKEFLKWDEDWR